MDNISTITDGMCCGCGACSIVCPGGVKLTLDKSGYYKSRINEDNCAHCGRCLKICPCTMEPAGVPVESYVGCCKSENDVQKSASGGAGYAIAKSFLERGYVIIGASWSDDFTKVEHIVVENMAGLERLRKSKYVQSYTVDAFRRIKKLEKVVVFGSPCQIAALRGLYGNRGGLVLVDFDCMGPAGLTLWNKALEYYNSLDNTGIKSVRMRDKKKSWLVYGTQVDFCSGATYWKDKFHDPFCILYHFGRIIQEGCVKHCKYLNSSVADLRISDAWNDTGGFTKRQIRNGLSIVTPITECGRNIVKDISSCMELREAKRAQQKLSHTACDERIVRCLENPDQTIWDAVRIYHDVGILKLAKRKISWMLSANDMVYLAIKRVLKKER